MNQIGRASSLLAVGESAIVLHTDGKLLQWEKDVPSESGNWRISQDTIDENNPRYVIVYLANHNRESQSNEVFIGTYGGIRPADPSTESALGRFVIKIEAARRVGITRLNWPEFAETGQNPVRFITRTN